MPTTQGAGLFGRGVLLTRPLIDMIHDPTKGSTFAGQDLPALLMDIQQWADALEQTTEASLELAECSRLLFGLTRPLMASKHVQHEFRSVVLRLKRSSVVVDNLLMDRARDRWRRKTPDFKHMGVDEWNDLAFLYEACLVMRRSGSRAEAFQIATSLMSDLEKRVKNNGEDAKLATSEGHCSPLPSAQPNLWGTTLTEAALALFGTSALITEKRMRIKPDIKYNTRALKFDPSLKVVDMREERWKMRPLEKAWASFQKHEFLPGNAARDTIGEILGVEGGCRVFSYYIGTNLGPQRRTDLVSEILKTYDMMRTYCLESPSISHELRPFLFSTLQNEEGKLLGELSTLAALNEHGEELDSRIQRGWPSAWDNAALLTSTIHDAITLDRARLHEEALSKINASPKAVLPSEAQSSDEKKWSIGKVMEHMASVIGNPYAQNPLTQQGSLLRWLSGEKLKEGEARSRHMMFFPQSDLNTAKACTMLAAASLMEFCSKSQGLGFFGDMPQQISLRDSDPRVATWAYRGPQFTSGHFQGKNLHEARYATEKGSNDPMSAKWSRASLTRVNRMDAMMFIAQSLYCLERTFARDGRESDSTLSATTVLAQQAHACSFPHLKDMERFHPFDIIDYARNSRVAPIRISLPAEEEVRGLLAACSFRMSALHQWYTALFRSYENRPLMEPYQSSAMLSFEVIEFLLSVLIEDLLCELRKHQSACMQGTFSMPVFDRLKSMHGRMADPIWPKRMDDRKDGSGTSGAVADVALEYAVATQCTLSDLEAHLTSLLKSTPRGENGRALGRMNLERQRARTLTQEPQNFTELLHDDLESAFGPLFTELLFCLSSMGFVGRRQYTRLTVDQLNSDAFQSPNSPSISLLEDDVITSIEDLIKQRPTCEECTAQYTQRDSTIVCQGCGKTVSVVDFTKLVEKEAMQRKRMEVVHQVQMELMEKLRSDLRRLKQELQSRS